MEANENFEIREGPSMVEQLYNLSGKDIYLHGYFTRNSKYCIFVGGGSTWVNRHLHYESDDEYLVLKCGQDVEKGIQCNALMKMTITKELKKAIDEAKAKDIVKEACTFYYGKVCFDFSKTETGKIHECPKGSHQDTFVNYLDGQRSLAIENKNGVVFVEPLKKLQSTFTKVFLKKHVFRIDQRNKSIHS